MKKTILIASLFSIAFLHGQAQVKWGIKAGANFYNFTGSGVKDAELNQYRQLKVGLIAGVISEIRLSKLFRLQPGVLYSQEGNLQSAYGNKIIYKFNYVNVPVMLQYRDRSGFFGETGPHLGFLTDAHVKSKSGGVSDEESVSDQAQKVVFAWAVGCGFVFKNGFGVNARSQWGLSNVVKDGGNIKSSGFNATVFYLF